LVVGNGLKKARFDGKTYVLATLISTELAF